MRNQRRRIWIDRFQTLLFTRIALYCIVYQAAVWVIFIVWRQLRAMRENFFGPEDLSNDWLAGLVVLLLLAPIVTYDAVKFAHRLVGPLYRFRKTIKALTAGEPVALVRLRQGDYLEDMRDELNAMLKALQERGLVVVTPEEPKDEPEARAAA